MTIRYNSSNFMTKNDDPGGPVAARSHFPKSNDLETVLGAKMVELVVGNPKFDRARGR